MRGIYLAEFSVVLALRNRAESADDASHSFELANRLAIFTSCDFFGDVQRAFHTHSLASEAIGHFFVSCNVRRDGGLSNIGQFRAQRVNLSFHTRVNHPFDTKWPTGGSAQFRRSPKEPFACGT